MSNAPAPLDESFRKLHRHLKPAQAAELAERVIEQERRLQAAITKMNEATSVVYAIYAEVQAARSALAP